MDKAAIERMAEAAHDLRCQLAVRDGERPAFIPDTWENRPPFLKDRDRAIVSLVAEKATEAAQARLDEIRQAITTFFIVNGGSAAYSMQAARDLAEGIRQILDRKPLGK